MENKQVGKMYQKCLEDISKLLSDHKPAFKSIKVCKGNKSVESILRDYIPLDDNRA